ncbi:phosphate transport system permease protein [Anaerocolumna cellulosilytica]|uniref:Phosphate transport system permease protein n=1 Tax=Anaerocolumna cellulosilytica TaxID=433286 RepID=A0A6S6RBU5_9FIRM|nr:phosphate ABC transporter permease subunit PstC [Anaerocolumna cellulosilytica]MBB5197835.1 phosphate transport system permease protein [Anaerocolumna cellulosilytica]BCJ96251.1 phosphate transport system permease protein [Anaerocolumna cellulosilytica]
MKKIAYKDNKISKRSEFPEKLFHGIFLVCALASVLSVIAIILFVFSKGLKPFFGDDAYSFLKFITGMKWDPGNDIYGVFYMIAGSVLATLGAIVLGVPIGLLTAVFIAEIAPKKLVAIIKPAIELLAGIPSVIYGAFGLGVIVPAINKISPTGQGESLLAVICVLTIMILPTIISLSESSIRAVPKSYREASLGLGASKTQTIFKAVIPAARSGILTATVLGIGRAIGETMAVMMIAGNNIGGLPKSIFSKIRPLTTNIAMEMGYASGKHQDMLFATGVILFVFIMVINITLIKLTSRLGSQGSSS